jgi:hypothetical protein
MNNGIKFESLDLEKTTLSVDMGNTFFMQDSVWIVAKADSGKFMLTSLENGNRWTHPETMEGIKITLTMQNAVPVEVTATIKRKV